MKKVFISMVVMLTVAVACDNKNIETLDNTPKVPVRISASIEMDVPTLSKVDFVDQANKDFQLKWEVGDTICIFNQVADFTTSPLQMNNLNRVTYVVTSVDSGTGSASFEPKAGSDMSVFGPSDTFYASMGGEGASWHSNYLCATDVIQSVLPADKNFIPKNRIDKASFIATSKATLAGDGSLTFKFHPVLGYLRLTVPDGCTLGSIRIYPNTASPASPNLSGFYQITVDGNGEFVSGNRTNGATAGGSPNILFFHKEPGDVSKSVFPAGTYYLPMLPDVRFRAIRCYPTTDGSGTYVGVTGKNQAITRGKVIDIGTLPVD